MTAKEKKNCLKCIIFFNLQYWQSYLPLVDSMWHAHWQPLNSESLRVICQQSLFLRGLFFFIFCCCPLWVNVAQDHRRKTARVVRTQRTDKANQLILELMSVISVWILHAMLWSVVVAISFGKSYVVICPLFNFLYLELLLL